MFCSWFTLESENQRDRKTFDDVFCAFLLLTFGGEARARPLHPLYPSGRGGATRVRDGQQKDRMS